MAKSNLQVNNAHADEAATRGRAIPKVIDCLPLQALNLSTKTFKRVRHAGIVTVGQLLEMELEHLTTLPLDETSLGELIDRVQRLHLLDPLCQELPGEPAQAASTGRHDCRKRPGRGKLRALSPHPEEEAEEWPTDGSALFGAYKVQVRHLPDALRMTLPRWTRCGIEQDEENSTDRSELPRRTQYCYVQAFLKETSGDLIEWRPGTASPSHYRAAATPNDLRRIACIPIASQDAQALLRTLENAAAPTRCIRVAPACFLTPQMRAMIAPGVAFLSEDGHTGAPIPLYEVFYYYPTGTTYDSPEGRLYQVQAALFADRLDGSRSGPVETLWLTRAQLAQSLPWQRELAHLDALELRTRVSTHALARGATLPQLESAEAQQAQRRQQLALEEEYNLVPLTSEDMHNVPLEMFISVADMREAEQHHWSPTAMVLHVLESYQDHPQAQPLGYRLSAEMLTTLHYWLKEDRKQRRLLNVLWQRHCGGQPAPAGPTMVFHEEYHIRRDREWNEETRRGEVTQRLELAGYRVLIGVLARTRVPGRLVVAPRHKPVCLAPERPIRPIRTPHYVPIKSPAA